MEERMSAYLFIAFLVLIYWTRISQKKNLDTLVFFSCSGCLFEEANLQIFLFFLRQEFCSQEFVILLPLLSECVPLCLGYAVLRTETRAPHMLGKHSTMHNKPCCLLAECGLRGTELGKQLNILDGP